MRNVLVCTAKSFDNDTSVLNSFLPYNEIDLSIDRPNLSIDRPIDRSTNRKTGPLIDLVGGVYPIPQYTILRPSQIQRSCRRQQKCDY